MKDVRKHGDFVLVDDAEGFQKKQQHVHIDTL